MKGLRVQPSQVEALAPTVLEALSDLAKFVSSPPDSFHSMSNVKNGLREDLLFMTCLGTTSGWGLVYGIYGMILTSVSWL